MLYPAELLGRICVGKSAIYRTVADATDAQQMAKCLAMLGCHLHAACGRCILRAAGAYGVNGHSSCILQKETRDVKKKMGEWILFQFSSLQIAVFRL